MSAPAGEHLTGPQHELVTLREQLREAQETLDAIRRGEVDAVVVLDANQVPRVYTLETADGTYRRLVEEMQEGALTVTAAGDILYCNPRMAQLLDLEPERVIGSSLRRFVTSKDWRSVVDLIAAESKGEFDIRSELGHLIPIHLSFSALRGGAANDVETYCCIVTDLTDQQRADLEVRTAHQALLMQVAERERTEQLLRQSQKMEAIGQLTGGVAHDFNNLLMVITGGLSMLAREPTPERRQRLLDGMRQAADRGSVLTRQLLAFSRRKDLHPEPIELKNRMDGMRQLLDGALGGDITVALAFDRGVWPVYVDAGDLEVAILNLCVNARDAMPQGGVITITACNRQNPVEHGMTGDFVQLSVSDTGQGMDPKTIARCLEPFYTTKEVGKGSGLGLAQVYGFARGAGGTVQIDSEPGNGTRVSLLLPRSEKSPRVAQKSLSQAAESAVESPAAGHVLLVEDDAAVASVTIDMLREVGYRVTHAASAQVGLNMLEKRPQIDLVLSDVMMPGGMDGVSFANEIRRREYGLPVVLVSGFAESVRADAEHRGIPLLAKPYSLKDLADTVSAAIVSARPALAR